MTLEMTEPNADDHIFKVNDRVQGHPLFWEDPAMFAGTIKEFEFYHPPYLKEGELMAVVACDDGETETLGLDYIVPLKD